ncbi:MAG: hypothetical protein AMXMBFR58_29220 [Phycisphaerae bacterium]
MSFRFFSRLFGINLVTSTRSIMHRSATLAGAAVAMGVVASAHAVVTNGSFEQPSVPVGSYTTYSGGSTGITGWTVVGVNVDVSETSAFSGAIALIAQDGQQWLDLTGFGSNSPSNGVTQDVPTAMGQLYRLSFYVGSATDNLNVFASTVDLSIDGGSRMSFTNPNTPLDRLDWQMFYADFVAASGTTNITFYNGSPGNSHTCGLDNVTLQAIPAPGAAALLGLGGLLTMHRRRVRTASMPSTACS